MIQRNGFVSNSSSSSFVLIVMKSEHLRVMAKITDFERAVINFAMKEEIFFGMAVMVYHELTKTDYSSIWGEGSDLFEYADWPKDQEGKRVSVFDVLERYTKAVHGFESTIYD